MSRDFLKYFLTAVLALAVTRGLFFAQTPDSLVIPLMLFIVASVFLGYLMELDKEDQSRFQHVLDVTGREIAGIREQINGHVSAVDRELKAIRDRAGTLELNMGIGARRQ